MTMILPPGRSVCGVRSRAVGLIAGAVLDAVLADPARWHPVAGFGRVAAALERRWYADSRAAGVAYTAVLVGGTVALGAVAERSVRRRPVARAGLTALATWTVLGGTSLTRHGAALARELGDPPPRVVRLGWSSGAPILRESFASAGRVVRPAPASRSLWPVEWCTLPPRVVLPGRASGLPRPPGEAGVIDLAAARARIPALCGRDPESLDAAGLARAGTESMAENTSDAVVAPLVWGAVAGLPGLLGYRAVNTLDAMVGYRSDRYRLFGWAAARLDDVANLVPARIAALLFAMLAPAVGGLPRAALAAWRRDAAGHPSPNAGPVEASAAGALGVGLGGRTVYAHGVEDRPRLGSGSPPTAADLARAARLSRLVGAAAAGLAAVAAWVG
jgi:adenosylcobinamide-phosphate synthase